MKQSLTVKIKSQNGYRNIINNHLIDGLGSYKLQDLKPAIINNYFKNKKDQGLSNNTIRKHYDLLKDALKHAVNEERIRFLRIR